MSFAHEWISKFVVMSLAKHGTFMNIIILNYNALQIKIIYVFLPEIFVFDFNLAELHCNCKNRLTLSKIGSNAYFIYTYGKISQVK